MLTICNKSFGVKQEKQTPPCCQEKNMKSTLSSTFDELFNSLFCHTIPELLRWLLEMRTLDFRITTHHAENTIELKRCLPIGLSCFFHHSVFHFTPNVL